MTTTYDPLDPQYLDEADVRDELDRGSTTCATAAGCASSSARRSRRCSSSIDAPRRPGRGPADAAPSRTRSSTSASSASSATSTARTCPGQHEWDARLPPADAARRRRCGTQRPASPVESEVTDQALGRTDLVGQARRRRPRRSPTRPSARPGSLAAQGHGEDGRHRRRAGAAAVRQAALLDVVPKRRPRLRVERRAGHGRAVPDLPRRVPGPGHRPGPGAGLRAQRHRVLAARGPGVLRRARGCTRATSTQFAEQAAQERRRSWPPRCGPATTSSCPSRRAATS